MSQSLNRLLCATLIAACGWCSDLFAGDWPQILGPHRNGHADGETLADSWPANGPRTVWQRKVGSGFSGLAVANGTAVVIHREADRERVEVMQAATGKVLHRVDFPVNYRATIVEDDGPRCVPLIHQGRVYVYGVQGGLRCIDLKSGKTIWARETHREFRAQEGYFGAGSSPIIEGARILVNVGGARAGAGIVAFDLDSGKTVWKVTDESASYSSPIAITQNSVRHVIFVTRYKVISLDPANGDIRFEFPFGKRGSTINGASPVVLDGHLFVSSSYGIGAVFAKIANRQVTEVWQDDRTLSSQYTTCVEHNGHLFGIHGRQDQGVAELRCFHPRTRRISWTKSGFGYATLITADGKLLILKSDGELVLAEANSDRYRELSRSQILKDTTRALPALSNGLFYARDTTTLKCVDLR